LAMDVAAGLELKLHPWAWGKHCRFQPRQQRRSPDHRLVGERFPRVLRDQIGRAKLCRTLRRKSPNLDRVCNERMSQVLAEASRTSIRPGTRSRRGSSCPGASAVESHRRRKGRGSCLTSCAVACDARNPGTLVRSCLPGHLEYRNFLLPSRKWIPYNSWPCCRTNAPPPAGGNVTPPCAV
jgi:hypothetical protein